ncbi:MAG TPA: plasmid pRiA4b ORF-3 family protein [Acidimicrobiales bacterium]|nr:plasmid pRiA4b ORF-3 family protein [Acidimicrobiales bacterium]
MPPPTGPRVVRLRITLDDVTPAVWRRLLVDGDTNLATLHRIFQAALGWTDSHLHDFTIRGQRYGTRFDDYPEEELDERGVTVLGAVGDHRRFAYEYDFGDSWVHQVVIEAVTPTATQLRFAVCLDGQNACPPEDCGGSRGYAELLEALADPDHEEHDEFAQWVGGAFDPEAFDLAAVNVALQHLR